MNTHKAISLALITAGVALCAAYGGMLPPTTKARESSRAALAQLKAQEGADQAKIADLSAQLKGQRPQAPQERLSEWLERAALPFGLGCVLIALGSLLARRSEGDEELAADGVKREPIDLGALLERIEAELKSLWQSAEGLKGGQSAEMGAEIGAEMSALRDRIKELQQGDLELLIDARGKVRSKHGITVFAELFGQISQGERRLNRAWSALVDEHAQESAHSLEGALASFQEARRRVSELSS